MLDITGWGIPVSSDVAIAVVHPMDVPQVVTYSLQSAMVHGICGSLQLLLGVDDRILMVAGSSLVLTLVLGVSKLESIPTLSFGMVNFCSPSFSFSILNLSSS